MAVEGGGVVRRTRSSEAVTLYCWRCGSELELQRAAVVREQAACPVCWARLEVALEAVP
jgi:DNA-directed RNA polymerase subunit RPC12/RpoP